MGPCKKLLAYTRYGHAKSLGLVCDWVLQNPVFHEVIGVVKMIVAFCEIIGALQLKLLPICDWGLAKKAFGLQNPVS